MNLLKTFRTQLLFIAMLVALTGCNESAPSTADIPAVTNFDLERYLGVWHEVARLPFRFENNMSNVTARYFRDEDGTIRVENSGIKDRKRVSTSGVVKFTSSPDTGELEVSFFRPFYGDYRIIMLDDDYTLAVVTTDKMDKLWILAREPFPDREKLSDVIGKLQKLNFDTSRLIFSQRHSDREL